MEKRFRVLASVDKTDGGTISIVMMVMAASAPAAMSTATKEIQASYPTAYLNSVIPVCRG
ncbi:hypothetical protein LU90_01710 [Salmonella enterica]|uniref:hypothetical protein n=1 Tax=Salmonella enterica TaxID=28901 RepID=UPI000B48C50D|nr:hypothetical protein [Salmonella enterica]EBR3871226.1 hypothetical protein [Salmonella enterica subsp. enterica]ASA50345.1 hypothetical protein GX95_04050 [Salmonella enterica subsp. enterica serovar Minnesota]EAW8860702.1 hypothetical protein [Salmonella enterica]EBP1378398.1 hypothetical protein [Salmonella enterica]EDS6394636.1 hypothetical protein [Salmonella enterica subsp. enterica serovar Minnesota]